jgi:hypothetical protein
VKIRIYEGAGRDFMRPGGPQHEADAASETLREIAGFFAANLTPLTRSR